MSKKITFGQVREIPQNADETREIPFVLSTPERDRHRTKLNQQNWSLDNYRKNPVIGYMHNLYGDMCNTPDPDDVIGQDKSTGIEDVNGATCLVGRGLFDPADVNLKAEKIFRKLLLGSLRAVSVGFQDIGKGAWGVGEEAEGRDNETFHFAGQELLEWSIVNIPSNAGAGKRNVSFMREQTHAALMYISRELGKNYRLSQLSEMRVQDILDLLDGKDLEIREKDPEKVRKMLADEKAQKDLADRIEAQQIEVRKGILAIKANH
jgi:hypothetical protein